MKRFIVKNWKLIKLWKLNTYKVFEFNASQQQLHYFPPVRRTDILIVINLVFLVYFNSIRFTSNFFKNGDNLVYLNDVAQLLNGFFYIYFKEICRYKSASTELCACSCECHK